MLYICREETVITLFDLTCFPLSTKTWQSEECLCLGAFIFFSILAIRARAPVSLLCINILAKVPFDDCSRLSHSIFFGSATNILLPGILSHPKSQFSTTLIVSFSKRRRAIQTIPKILQSGITPSAIEYIEKEEIEKTEEHLSDEWSGDKAKSQLIIILTALIEDELYSMCADSETIGRPKCMVFALRTRYANFCFISFLFPRDLSFTISFTDRLNLSNVSSISSSP